MAQNKPKDDEDRNDKEYVELLLLFDDLIKDIRNEKQRWASLEDLIRQRADFAVRHAFDGFSISYDDALKLLKNAEDLTDEQRTKRDILVAAVDNLVDFSAAEEYQMCDEVCDMIEEEFSEEESEDEDSDDYEEAVYAIFRKYNKRYARVENLDIQYAMMMASYLMLIDNNTYLTYMTMGDERVRPWHLQFEGYTAPRSSFPSWLIPPIEHQCRCFLVEDTKASVIADVQASKTPEIPEWFDGTFKESVANGGRIFSEEHPYFSIDKKDMKKLRKIADKVKALYF